MAPIKQPHVISSDFHTSSSLAKSYVAQPTSEWHSMCLRGTQLDGTHAKAPAQHARGQRLQQAYRQHIEPYSKHLQFAVTLTLKKSAAIRVNRFENYGDEKFKFTAVLDDEKLESLIKYFTALLRHQLYGNKAKHKNKQDWATPLVIAVVEGKTNHKRTHLHLAVGNIPADKLESFTAIVESTWHRCDFAYREICTKTITDGNGWLGYITKEVGYANDDALDIVRSTIPPFIQKSICTESRLLAA